MNKEVRVPSFASGSISSISFFDYVRWVEESVGLHCREPLGLPPMQRTALWTPRHILGLWDSLLRGMPIGMFFLIPGAPGSERRPVYANEGKVGHTVKDHGGGYDLLDGQQRTRAMMLALRTPKEEGRCLWVDLGAAAKSEGSVVPLRLTTKSQPFGYDVGGWKLGLDARRAAREAFDGPIDGPAECRVAAGNGVGTRRAYDHELFELEMNRNPGSRPPKPAGATQAALPLLELLALWKKTSRDGECFKAELQQLISPALMITANVNALIAAFGRLDCAEIALILVHQPNAEDEQKDAEWLLRLFERIGAGGVPLSNAERLFSIYKHHEPYVHDTVAAIEASVGRVMPATEIAGTALRIAAAQAKEPAFGVPDVKTFAKTMAAGRSAFRDELDRLLPKGKTIVSGSLADAFQDLFAILSYDEKHNPRGLPSVMLVELPSEPVQVMAFWVVLAKAAGSDLSAFSAQDESIRRGVIHDETIRGEMVRFALFWHLCSSNNAKGGLQAFRFLRKWANGLRTYPDGATSFPGRQLYETLTGDDRSALSLVPPDAVRTYGAHAPSSQWRSSKARFEREGFEEPTKAVLGTKDLYRTWWWSRGKMLLWLQRRYLEREFAGYDPSSDRDDDKPYDLDHIQPQAAWNFDWRSREEMIENSDDHDQFRSERDQLGNGIGNLRWIGSSENRSDGAKGLVEKLRLRRFVQVTEQPGPDPWMASVFDVRDRATVDLWLEAGANGRWTPARMRAFQQVVEERATWLFQQLWEGAGFSRWLPNEEATLND